MGASLRYWTIIPAAGTSRRMKSDEPKQYLPISNTTVIEASLHCFLNHPDISGVIVALNADDQHWNTLGITRNEKIHTVVGGGSRAKSVENAVEYLENTSAKENDFVLVHDAARPCLRCSDLDLLMTQLKDDEVGGILASPVSDTLKLADQQTQSSHTISKTVDRDSVWRAFTPQMFRLKLLKQALSHCFERNIPITDDASAIEALGLRVKLIQGHADNIKITHQDDLKIAETILKKIMQ